MERGGGQGPPPPGAGGGGPQSGGGGAPPPPLSPPGAGRGARRTGGRRGGRKAHPANAAAPSPGGGPGKKKKKKKKKRKGAAGGGGGGGGGAQPKGPVRPFTGSLKISVRHISDAARRGTKREVVAMISDLLDEVNAQAGARGWAAAGPMGPAISATGPAGPLDPAIPASGLLPPVLVRLDAEASRLLCLAEAVREEEVARRAAREEEEAAAAASKAEAATAAAEAGDPAGAEEVAEDGADDQGEAEAEADGGTLDENEARDLIAGDRPATVDEPAESALVAAMAKLGLMAHCASSGLDRSGFFEDAITARIMSVVPPKKTRRRGEVGGTATLVLTPPVPAWARERIEQSEAAATAAAAVKAEAEAAAAAAAAAVTAAANQEAKEDTAPDADQERTDGPLEVAGAPAAQSVASPATPNAFSKAELSQILGQARLYQHLALRTIASVLEADRSSGQRFGSAVAVESPSQKVWKDPNPVLRRRGGGDPKLARPLAAALDSKLEQSPDYLRFIAGMQRSHEERAKRPKPAPGGGGGTGPQPAAGPSEGGSSGQHGGGAMPTNMPGAMGIDAESGEALSALVLHLRAKNDAKKAKLKLKQTRKKREARLAKERQAALKAKAGGKSKGRKGGRRKDKAKAAKGSSSAPTSIKPRRDAAVAGNSKGAGGKSAGRGGRTRKKKIT